MWGDLIDFFLPKRCVVCGELEIDLCKKCERELGFASQICPMCEEESVMGWTHKSCKKKWSLEGLITLFEYGDPAVRKVIDGIKYDFIKDLVGRLFKPLKIETGVSFDYIVPVPLYFYRQNWRGFNQAELIASELQKQIGGEVANLLVRKKNTKQQAMMKSRGERESNVKNAFALDHRLQMTDIRKKNVLLVDDVFTTGSNMKECCRVLKKADVETVWGFVLGH